MSAFYEIMEKRIFLFPTPFANVSGAERLAKSSDKHDDDICASNTIHMFVYLLIYALFLAYPTD